MRTIYPNLGKAKLQVLLRPWCAQQGLALPSVSTIGRLIARAPDKMRHAPGRLDARGRPKPLVRARKAQPPKAVAMGPCRCSRVIPWSACMPDSAATFSPSSIPTATHLIPLKKAG